MRRRLTFYITLLFACAILDALQRFDRETAADLREFFHGWLISIFCLFFGGSDDRIKPLSKTSPGR